MTAAPVRRVLVCLTLLGAAGVAVAQQAPVFTAPSVQPYGEPERTEPASPDLKPSTRPGTRRPEAAVRSTGTQLKVRGLTPRAQADDVVAVFEQACLRGQASAEFTADWALQHGFEPAPQDIEARLPASLIERGGTASGFLRTSDKESVLLSTVVAPEARACIVMGLRKVDGARLRAAADRTISAWAGTTSAPKPVITQRFGGDGLAPGTLVGYRRVVGTQVQNLFVGSHDGVAAGVAFLYLAVEDTPPAR